MVLAYIYATRIIVYLIESTIPFKLEWVGYLLDEIITLAFYSITAYMFSPLPDNEYLRLPTEDEEGELLLKKKSERENFGISTKKKSIKNNLQCTTKNSKKYLNCE